MRFKGGFPDNASQDCDDIESYLNDCKEAARVCLQS